MMHRFIIFLRTAVVVIVSVVIAFGGVEISLRKFSRLYPLDLPWLVMPGAEKFWVADKDLIYTNVHMQNLLNQPARQTNDMRDIVVLGDSFVYGNSVAYKDNVTSKLQQLLDQRSPGYNVVNLGVAGYGTDQEFRMFQKYLYNHPAPKIVFWAIFTNDIYENQLQAVFRTSEDGALIPLNTRSNWIYDRQVFYDAIPLDRHIKNQSYTLNRMLYIFGSHKFDAVPRLFKKDPSAWSVNKIRAEMIAMESLSEKLNFALYYVLIYPQATYLRNEDVPNTLRWAINDHNKLYEIFRSSSHFIPLDFSNHDSTLSADRIRDDIFSDESKDPLIRGIHHFNEKGYQMFAEKLFSYIQ